MQIVEGDDEAFWVVFNRDNFNGVRVVWVSSLCQFHDLIDIEFEGTEGEAQKVAFFSLSFSSFLSLSFFSLLFLFSFSFSFFSFSLFLFFLFFLSFSLSYLLSFFSFSFSFCFSFFSLYHKINQIGHFLVSFNWVFMWMLSQFFKSLCSLHFTM